MNSHDQKQRDSFVFYRSYYEAAKSLDEKSKTDLYEAILEYGLNHNQVELQGIAGGMFSLIKPLLEKNYQNWLKGCRGGAPSEAMKGNDNARKNKAKTNLKQSQNKPNELCIMSNDLCLRNNDLSLMGNENNNPSSLLGNPVISLPLNTKNHYKDIFQNDITSYSDLYPNVDVIQEFRNMLGWLNANPTKRKTSKGIDRFINNWLCTKQDKWSASKKTDKKSSSLSIEDMQNLKGSIIDDGTKYY